MARVEGLEVGVRCGGPFGGKAFKMYSDIIKSCGRQWYVTFMHS